VSLKVQGGEIKKRRAIVRVLRRDPRREGDNISTISEEGKGLKKTVTNSVSERFRKKRVSKELVGWIQDFLGSLNPGKGSA